MPVDTAPCDWDIIECEPCSALDDVPANVQSAVEAAAVEYLWRWTGHQYGLCEVELRPCRKDCPPSTFRGPVVGPSWWPVLIGGEWFNVKCPKCGDRCWCESISEIVLPGPVNEVTEVRIDGNVLHSDNYRVDDWTRLVRVDGGEWPRCQQMGLPPTEDGTFQVTYKKGLPVPDAGKIAAGVLKCEFAKSLCGDDSCALPGRVTQIVREGATLAMFDPSDPEKGLTGIFLVDSFITSVRAPKRMRISNPDTWLRQRQRTS